MVPEQTIIKVTGPDSIVERIKEVKAVVDVTGIPTTTVKNCALKLYDADGDLIDNTYLNYVGKSDGINVTVSMLNTKTIPLVFNYSGTPAENYKVIDVDWKPETIEIAGNAEVLTALTNLRIPAEVVNVDGISEELQLIVDVTEYLPSGVIVKEESSASVLVIVEVEYTEPVEEEVVENTVSEEDETEKQEETKEPSKEPTQEVKPEEPENTTGESSEEKIDTNESKIENDTSAESGNDETQNDQEKETVENEKTENNS